MKNMFRKSAIGSLAIGVMAVGMLAFPATMAAKGASVIHTGNCSASSDWKLKAKPDNGKLEVEFEVDQNVNSQVWRVKLKDNGSTFWHGLRTTHSPSGSFSVTKRTANNAGTDTITGRAVNLRTGEVCQGSLNI